ncbi:MAG: secretin N-terminal domain-containing protein, partial [Thermoguttaceae bacterium]
MKHYQLLFAVVFSLPTVFGGSSAGAQTMNSSPPPQRAASADSVQLKSYAIEGMPAEQAKERFLNLMSPELTKYTVVSTDTNKNELTVLGPLAAIEFADNYFPRIQHFSTDVQYGTLSPIDAFAKPGRVVQQQIDEFIRENGELLDNNREYVLKQGENPVYFSNHVASPNEKPDAPAITGCVYRCAVKNIDALESELNNRFGNDPMVSFAISEDVASRTLLVSFVGPENIQTQFVETLKKMGVLLPNTPSEGPNGLSQKPTEPEETGSINATYIPKSKSLGYINRIAQDAIGKRFVRKNPDSSNEKEGEKQTTGVAKYELKILRNNQERLLNVDFDYDNRKIVTDGDKKLNDQFLQLIKFIDSSKVEGIDRKIIPVRRQNSAAVMNVAEIYAKRTQLQPQPNMNQRSPVRQAGFQGNGRSANDGNNGYRQPRPMANQNGTQNGTQVGYNGPARNMNVVPARDSRPVQNSNQPYNPNPTNNYNSNNYNPNNYNSNNSRSVYQSNGNVTPAGGTYRPNNVNPLYNTNQPNNWQGNNGIGNAGNGYTGYENTGNPIRQVVRKMQSDAPLPPGSGYGGNGNNGGNGSPTGPLTELSGGLGNPFGYGIGYGDEFTGRPNGDAGFDVPQSLNIMAIPELDIILFEGTGAEFKRFEKLVADIEALMKESVAQWEIIPLKHADCISMQEMLADMNRKLGFQMKAGRFNVIPLRNPNAMLLIGYGAAYNDMKNLIESLDKQLTEPGTRWKLVTLRYVSATYASQIIRNLFQYPPDPYMASDGTTTGYAWMPRIRAIPDVRTNSLIIGAGPGDLMEAEKLLKTIDIYQSGSKLMTKEFPLKNALVNDVSQALTSILSIGTTGIGNTQDLKFPEFLLEKLDGNTRRVIESGILTDVKVTPYPQQNKLFISAPEYAIPLISELISILDSPMPNASIKIFRILYGDAGQMITTITAILPTQVAGRTVQLPGSSSEEKFIPLKLTAEVRTNSIIAVGGEADLEALDAIIRSLDQESKTKPMTEVYQLKNQDARMVAGALR